MINKCIDYLEQNGYYGHVYDDMNSAIAFKVAEELCFRFTDGKAFIFTSYNQNFFH